MVAENILLTVASVTDLRMSLSWHLIKAVIIGF